MSVERIDCEKAEGVSGGVISPQVVELPDGSFAIAQVFGKAPTREEAERTVNSISCACAHLHPPRFHGGHGRHKEHGGAFVPHPNPPQG